MGGKTKNMNDEEKPPGTLVTGIVIKKKPGDLAGVHLQVRHGKVWISDLTDEAARNPINPLKIGDLVFEIQDRAVEDYTGGIREMRAVIENDEKIRILAQRQDPEASSISTDSDYRGELEMERGDDEGNEQEEEEAAAPAPAPPPKVAKKKAKPKKKSSHDESEEPQAKKKKKKKKKPKPKTEDPPEEGTKDEDEPQQPADVEEAEGEKKEPEGEGEEEKKEDEKEDDAPEAKKGCCVIL